MTKRTSRSIFGVRSTVGEASRTRRPGLRTSCTDIALVPSEILVFVDAIRPCAAIRVLNSARATPPNFMQQHCENSAEWRREEGLSSLASCSREHHASEAAATSRPHSAEFQCCCIKFGGWRGDQNPQLFPCQNRIKNARMLPLHDPVRYGARGNVRAGYRSSGWPSVLCPRRSATGPKSTRCSASRFSGRGPTHGWQNPSMPCVRLGLDERASSTTAARFG